MAVGCWLLALVTLANGQEPTAKSQQKLLSYDPERLGDEFIADAVVYSYR